MKAKQAIKTFEGKKSPYSPVKSSASVKQNMMFLPHDMSVPMKQRRVSALQRRDPARPVTGVGARTPHNMTEITAPLLQPPMERPTAKMQSVLANFNQVESEFTNPYISKKIKRDSV